MPSFTDLWRHTSFIKVFFKILDKTLLVTRPRSFRNQDHLVQRYMVPASWNFITRRHGQETLSPLIWVSKVHKRGQAMQAQTKTCSFDAVPPQTPGFLGGLKMVSSSGWKLW